ncbi:hypothetical protein bcere0017_31770 [Bacillus cereus Rock1-3]|nr:hypothetical protein bcere0017_31770 [Bacillus cereus Rock1-3]
MIVKIQKPVTVNPLICIELVDPLIIFALTKNPVASTENKTVTAGRIIESILSGSWYSDKLSILAFTYFKSFFSNSINLSLLDKLSVSLENSLVCT